MQYKLIVIGVLAFASAPSAQAQISLDVSKVTCDQYVHNKAGNTRTLAAWFSGYYSAKRNNLVVDLQAVEAVAQKVQEYCENQSNWKVPVMQAIEQLGARK